MTRRTQGVPRSVAFVGPLPPPLHGLSAACAAMLALLQNRGTVAVFDRSPCVNFGNLSADRTGLARAQRLSFEQAQPVQASAEAQLTDVIVQILGA